MSTKIILDCDPGHDDAVAILLAVGNPNIDLLGVTTVGGNQSLDKVTYNARAVVTPSKKRTQQMFLYIAALIVRFCATLRQRQQSTAKLVLMA